MPNTAPLCEGGLPRLRSPPSPQSAGGTPASLQTGWVLSLGLNQDTGVLTLPSLTCPVSRDGKEGELR